jgi:hypothetical protein
MVAFEAGWVSIALTGNDAVVDAFVVLSNIVAAGRADAVLNKSIQVACGGPKPLVMKGIAEANDEAIMRWREAEVSAGH